MSNNTKISWSLINVNLASTDIKAQAQIAIKHLSKKYSLYKK